MKKLLATVIVSGLLLSACLPAFTQPQTASNPTPISELELQATAAILSQQTLQALPSPTTAPSETPVVLTPTNTPIPETPTETQNPFLLTLTATLGTGTVTAESLTGTADASAVIVGTASATLNPPPTDTTPQPQFYGTLPPSLPYGTVVLFNKSHADAYVSLRCVTKDGYITIIEYPVEKMVKAKAPAGNYTYVAWVGGRQFSGSFSLSKDDILTMTLLLDKVTFKNSQE